MKGIDIFCASQASTAICLSMDEASSSSSTIQLGGRAIDRHNPIIRDTRRSGGRAPPSVPCSSQPPINPKSYHQLQKTKKSSSNSTKPKPNDQTKKSSSSSKQNDHQKRKSTSNSHAKLADYIKTSSFASSSTPSDVATRNSWAKAADLVTPPGSSRYLLSDAGFLGGLSDHDPVLSLVPVGNKKAQITTVNQEESSSTTAKDSSTSNQSKPASSDQVI